MTTMSGCVMLTHTYFGFVLKPTSTQLSDVTEAPPSWPLCNRIVPLTVHFSLVHFCTYSDTHSIAISYHIHATSSQSYYGHVYRLLHSSSLIAQRSQLLHWSEP